VSDANAAAERNVGDVPNPGEDLPRGQIRDPAQFGQGGAAGRDGGTDLGVGRGDAPVEVADLGDQFDGQRPQGRCYRIAEPDPT